MQIDAKLPFYEAFRLIQIGSFRYMRLPHWKEDVEIHVQLPDDYSKMTHPYLYVKSRFGLVPWIPTQVEMFRAKSGKFILKILSSVKTMMYRRNLNLGLENLPTMMMWTMRLTWIKHVDH